MIAGTLEIQLLADMARLQKDMNDAKRMVGGAMGAIEKSVSMAKAALGGLVAGLVAGASITMFAQIVKGSIDSAAALHDLHIQTGASVEALSGLAEIGKYSEVSTQQIAGAMTKLAKNMAGATEESKGAGKALEALGINFDDFKRLSADQQMLTVAKAMNKFEDGTGKAAVAMALYGKEGAQMLPFMKDLASAGELQAKVTAEQAAMADNFGDNLTKVQASGDAWKRELSMGILPAMHDLSEAWLVATNGSGGLRDQVRQLASDGTLDRWARGAVIGLTYLMDVGQGLISIFPLVGKGIAGVIAATSVGLSAAWEAWQRFQKADFEGAWAALKNGVTGVKTVAAEASADIAAIWNQELLGEKIRRGMEDAKKARTETNAEAAKAQLDFTNVNGKDEALKAANKELKEQQKLLAESVGLTGDFYEKWDRLNAMYKRGALSTQELAAAQAHLLDKQPVIKKAHEEEKKALEEVAKANLAAAEAHTKFYADMATGVDKLKAESRAQKELNDRIGLTKEEIAALDAAKLEEQATTLEGLAIKRLDKDLDEGIYELYKAQAAELRKLADLKREGASKQTAVDEAKAAADAWKKTTDDIERTLTDALMRGFETGKGFARNLRDTVVNMFKTMVLRPIISAVINPIAGAITGAIGSAAGGNLLGTAATSAAGSAVGSSIGGLGGAMTIASNIGGGAAAGFAQLTAGVNPVSALSSAMDVAANSVSTALGQVMGYLGPILLAIGVLVKGLSYKTVGAGIMGSIQGDDFTGSSYQFKKSTLRGSKTVTSALDPSNERAFSTAVESMAETFNQLGKVTGTGSNILKDFNYSFRLALADFDEEGKKKEIQRFFSAMSDSMAMAFVDTFRTTVDTAAQAASRYWTNTIDGEAARPNGPSNIVSQARVSTPLDPYIDDMLRLFDAQRASLEGVDGAEGKLATFTEQLFTLGNQLAENAGLASTFGTAIDFKVLEAAAQKGENVVDTFNRLNTVFAATNAIVDVLGQDAAKAFGAVGVASAEARARLIELSGGIENLNAGASFFAAQFLSEAERIAPVQKAVSEEMSRLGYAGVTTHQQFKEAVVKLFDSGAIATEAGAETYAALMKIAPAFDAVADAAISGAETLSAAEKQARQVTLDAAEQQRQVALSLVDTMFDSLTRSVDAERKQITEAHEKAMAAIEASMKSASESIGVLSRRSDSLRNTLDRLRAPDHAGTYRAEAQAFLSTALTVIRAGGRFTDDRGLQRALDMVSQPSEDLYSSFTDYQRDFYQTAIAISDLSEATSVQLTVEERALEALVEQKRIAEESYKANMARLDGILAAAQATVDAVHGVDTTLMSVAQALASLNGAIAAARLAGAGSTGAGFANSGSALAAINQAYQSSLYRAPEAAGLQYWQGQVAGGASIDSVVQAIANSNEAKVQQLYGSVLGRVGEAEGVSYWTNLLNSGMSLAEMTGHFQSSAEYVSKTAQYQSDLANGVYRRLPGFADGGFHAGGWRVVGERGPELEFTGPSSIVSNATTSRMLDMSAMEQEIKGMRNDMRQMQATVIRNTGRMADTVDRWEKNGMPEQRDVESA